MKAIDELGSDADAMIRELIEGLPFRLMVFTSDLDIALKPRRTSTFQGLFLPIRLQSEGEVIEKEIKKRAPGAVRELRQLKVPLNFLICQSVLWGWTHWKLEKQHRVEEESEG
jgi:hypothetical protein